MLLRICFWLWSQPQTLIGWVLSLFIGTGGKKFRGSTVVFTPYSPKDWEFGFSFGPYIFVGKTSEHNLNLLRHEYGHSIQSIILGPLYQPVIGIQWIISRITKIFDRKFDTRSDFVELWASELGDLKE